MSDPGRPEKPEHKQFPLNHVEQGMTRHFPHCTGEHRAEIVSRITEREWLRKTKIVTALSITVHNYIRHNLTEYEELIGKRGITGDEARIIVQPELDEWFEFWHSGHDPAKPDPSTARPDQQQSSGTPL